VPPMESSVQAQEGYKRGSSGGTGAWPARPWRTQLSGGLPRMWLGTAVARGGCEAREAKLVAAPGLRRAAPQRQRALLVGHGGGAQ